LEGEIARLQSEILGLENKLKEASSEAQSLSTAIQTLQAKLN
jgi:CII-binding regulator of phage lambda lysogenization HflD